MLLSSPTDPDGTNLPRRAGRSGLGHVDDAKRPADLKPAGRRASPLRDRPKFLTRTCYKGGHVLRPGLRVDTHGCPARRPARADRPLPSLPAEDSPLSPDAGAEGRRGSRLRGVARHRSRSESVRRHGERLPLLDLHDRAAPADRSPAGSGSATHRPRQRGEPWPCASEEFDPTSSLEYGEALSCLGLLPREWAEIVLLRVVGGLDSAEVAAITGRKAGTVRVIQKRALEQLAELLSSDREKAVTR